MCNEIVRAASPFRIRAVTGGGVFGDQRNRSKSVAPVVHERFKARSPTSDHPLTPSLSETMRSKQSPPDLRTVTRLFEA